MRSALEQPVYVVAGILCTSAERKTILHWVQDCGASGFRETNRTGLHFAMRTVGEPLQKSRVKQDCDRLQVYWWRWELWHLLIFRILDPYLLRLKWTHRLQGSSHKPVIFIAFRQDYCWADQYYLLKILTEVQSLFLCHKRSMNVSVWNLHSHNAEAESSKTG